MNILIDKSPFCFKGERKYIHGTDIFARIIRLIKSVNYDSIDLTFHGICYNNLNIFLTDENINKSEIKFFVKIGGLDEQQEFYGIDNNLPVDCSYSYNEDNIFQSLKYKKDDFSTTIFVNNFEFTTIELIVASNKFLIQSIFPFLEGKLYFTRLKIKDFKTFNSIYTKIVLSFDRDFNKKLFKTSIIFDSVNVGEIFFSLVK